MEVRCKNSLHKPIGLYQVTSLSWNNCNFLQLFFLQMNCICSSLFMINDVSRSIFLPTILISHTSIVPGNPGRDDSRDVRRFWPVMVRETNNKKGARTRNGVFYMRIEKLRKCLSRVLCLKIEIVPLICQQKCTFWRKKK